MYKIINHISIGTIYSDISDSELAFITEKFHTSKYKSLKIVRYEESENLYGIPKTIEITYNQYGIIWPQNKVFIMIGKDMDDWFFIEINSKNTYVYYKCDQIDGLSKCLDDIS